MEYQYETVTALRRVNQSIRKYIEAMQKPEPLTGANGWILAYLADHADAEIYQRDLEKQLGIGRSAISKSVAALEKDGLLERSRVLSDDRLKKLVLTAEGRQYTEQIRSGTQLLEQQLTDGFSEAELELLQQFFLRMQQNLSNRI